MHLPRALLAVSAIASATAHYTYGELYARDALAEPDDYADLDDHLFARGADFDDDNAWGVYARSADPFAEPAAEVDWEDDLSQAVDLYRRALARRADKEGKGKGKKGTQVVHAVGKFITGGKKKEEQRQKEEQMQREEQMRREAHEHAHMPQATSRGDREPNVVDKTPTPPPRPATPERPPPGPLRVTNPNPSDSSSSQSSHTGRTIPEMERRDVPGPSKLTSLAKLRRRGQHWI